MSRKALGLALATVALALTLPSTALAGTIDVTGTSGDDTIVIGSAWIPGTTIPTTPAPVDGQAGMVWAICHIDGAGNGTLYTNDNCGAPPTLCSGYSGGAGPTPMQFTVDALEGDDTVVVHESPGQLFYCPIREWIQNDSGASTPYSSPEKVLFGRVFHDKFSTYITGGDGADVLLGGNNDVSYSVGDELFSHSVDPMGWPGDDFDDDILCGYGGRDFFTGDQDVVLGTVDQDWVDGGTENDVCWDPDASTGGFLGGDRDNAVQCETVTNMSTLLGVSRCPATSDEIISCTYPYAASCYEFPDYEGGGN